MREKQWWTVVSISALSTLCAVCAQASVSLRVGDSAPPLKVETWVKGSPFQFQRGKVYVVEFWATWCGPCIDSMPHLSDLADKMKGKVEVVSVNVFDRNPEGEAVPGSKAHRDRIAKWVRSNANKMRYNVALDDAGGTMAKTWMAAAGQKGIPCAFVVNQKGAVAWVGHPGMGLEKVVELVYEKKLDKLEYDKVMKPQLEAEAEKESLIKVARTGNLQAVEKAYSARVEALKHPDLGGLMAVIEPLSKKNPAGAVEFLRNRSTGDFRDDWSTIGAMAVYIAPNVQVDRKASKELVELSLHNLNTVKDGTAAIICAYHAQVLFATGDRAGADKWLKMAAGKVGAYEPAQYRKNIRKYIDDTRSRFAKAGKH